MTINFRTKRGSIRPGKSRFEAEIKAEIEMNGIIGTDTKRKRLNYTEEHYYVPDFVLPNGIVIEAKGYFPREDRTKMLAVKQANPGVDIRLVFLRANSKCEKDGKMTYGEWADKYGFTWANRHLPIEWLYEKGANTNTKD